MSSSRIINSKRSSDHYEVVIVGGGIAGLTAAWSLRDRNICLLEAAERVGGEIKSEVRGPYWVNLGAHIVHEGGIIARLAGELGVPIGKMKGSFLNVAMGGKVVNASRPAEFVFRLPISLPARLSLAIAGLRLTTAQLQARFAISKAHKHLPHALQIKETPYLERLERSSYADLLGPLHQEIEPLMQVLANRIGGELHEISGYAGLMNYSELWGSGLANIIGGSAQLTEAIKNGLKNSVQTRAQVTCIDRNDCSVEIEYRIGGEQRLVSADTCILAVPAKIAKDLIHNLPKDQEEILSQVQYCPYVVAGFFTKEASIMPWDNLYALIVPGRSFCMLFNPANVVRQSGERALGGSLVVYTAGEGAVKLLAMSDNEISEQYLTDLYDIFPEARGIVQEVIIQRWPLGVPISFPGRAKLQPNIADSFGPIFFSGNYANFIGLGMEISAKSGLDAADLVRLYIKQKT